MSFEEFMARQIAAIESSGMEPEEWIVEHAEEFRAAHPVTEDEACEA